MLQRTGGPQMLLRRPVKCRTSRASPVAGRTDSESLRSDPASSKRRRDRRDGEQGRADRTARSGPRTPCARALSLALDWRAADRSGAPNRGRSPGGSGRRECLESSATPGAQTPSRHSIRSYSLVECFMTPSSQESEPPEVPGRFTLLYHGNG